MTYHCGFFRKSIDIPNYSGWDSTPPKDSKDEKMLALAMTIMMSMK